MKFSLKYLKPFTFICLFLLLTGFLGFGKKSTNHAPGTGTASDPIPSQKVIALLPIQKTFQAPIYLSTQPGFLNVAKRMIKEQRLIFGKTVDYDPGYVEKELGRALSFDITKKGFLVFTPEQTAPYVKEYDFDKELPLEDLNKNLKADAFFLVTITDWKAENFDSSGSVRLGFQAALIDSVTKQVVWTNQVKSLKLDAPSKDFLYSKQQSQLLQELAGRVLKKFPKKEWHEA